MKTRIGSGSSSSLAELCVLLVADGVACDGGPRLKALVAAAMASGDVKTTFRGTVMFRQAGKAVTKRLCCIGLGREQSIHSEQLRRVAALSQAVAEDAGASRFALLIHAKTLGKLDAEQAGAAVAEGLILGAYRYAQPQKEPHKPRKGQDCEVVLLGGNARDFARGFAFGEVGARATVFARDLENQPSNICTPTSLASAAKKLAVGGVTVKVLDRAKLQKLGMHALLGVARGSVEAPKFIALSFGPARGKTVCVIGKGLTFDTGGLSIKPASKMDEMRYDMCGAGAVLGLFHALRSGLVKPRHRIVGLIAATENGVGPAAQKPGDVVRAMDGHTIEVLNTDAEGRLVLADAIAYGKKFYAPARIVDLATLTGAVVVALGHEVAGIMGNDQKLCDELISAGKAADEPLWQLPLWDVHKEQMKSKFADLANINAGQGNGATAGAAFLSVFAGDTPWVHLDIAGTSYGGVSKDYYKSGASGTAVRTLLRFVETL